MAEDPPAKSEDRTERAGMAFADVWKEKVFPVIQDDYAAMLQMVPLRVLAVSDTQRKKGESRRKTKQR